MKIKRHKKADRVRFFRSFHDPSSTTTVEYEEVRTRIRLIHDCIDVKATVRRMPGK